MYTLNQSSRVATRGSPSMSHLPSSWQPWFGGGNGGVRAHCDNEAVVYVMSSRSCKNPELMHLLHCLFFIEADSRFSLSVVHIAGVANDLADDLSHNRPTAFLSMVPRARQLPTPLPLRLIEVLLDTSSTWTSPDWTW